MRIALGIQYDGAAFCGWQSQPHGKTVQDVSSARWRSSPRRRCTRRSPGAPIPGCTVLARSCISTRRRSRRVLLGARHQRVPAADGGGAVGEGDAGHVPCALRRLRADLPLRAVVHPVRSPMLTGRAGWVHTPLDVDAMREAAACLIGEHDFSAFRSSECQAKTPVKPSVPDRHPARHGRFAEARQDGGFIHFRFRANAFLHHMVRNLMGCLVAVGRGRYPASWLAEVLASRDRSQAAPGADLHAGRPVSRASRLSGGIRGTARATRQRPVERGVGRPWTCNHDRYPSRFRRGGRALAASHPHQAVWAVASGRHRSGAVALGADAIGLVFYPKSPRAVTPAQAAELARRVPPFVTVVGLFVNADADALARIMDQVPLSLLQFHGDETPEQCAALARVAGALVARAARRQHDAARRFARIVTSLFGSPRPPVRHARRRLWRRRQGIRLVTYSRRARASGRFEWWMTAENVGDAIRQLRPFAVDVSSGIEMPGAKGVKDHARMAAFVRAVRNADAQDASRCAQGPGPARRTATRE